MEEIGEVDRREECVIEWTIRDFCSLPAEVDKPVHSPLFPSDGAQWRLRFFPNGQKKNVEGYIDVFLTKQSRPPIEMKYSIGLKTSKSQIIKETHYICNFDKQFTSHGSANFIKRSTILERKSELLPSGHLTWVCRLKHPAPASTSSVISTEKCAHCKETVDSGHLSFHERKCLEKPIKCPECSDIVSLKDWYAHECQRTKTKGDNSASKPVVKSKILEDLKQLLQNQENCDVVLRVKGREFSAHKAILSARSSVFASTFRNDMKEKATGVVNIDDCDPSTFSDFLHFLYCEDVEALSNENVFSLFTAADKYDVSDLRAKCLKFVKENLSVDTFCDTLTLALRHSETEVVRSATDFFLANANQIIVTVAWQTFVAENPTQGNELFIKYVSVKH